MCSQSGITFTFWPSLKESRHIVQSSYLSKTLSEDLSEKLISLYSEIISEEVSDETADTSDSDLTDVDAL